MLIINLDKAFIKRAFILLFFGRVDVWVEIKKLVLEYYRKGIIV